MTEPTWRFLYFDIKKDPWLTDYSPTFDEAARLRTWRTVIETEGFPPGTVFWEDENFAARVPDTRIAVAGIAVPYEGLLIVKAITSIGLLS